MLNTKVYFVNMYTYISGGKFLELDSLHPGTSAYLF